MPKKRIKINQEKVNKSCLNLIVEKKLSFDTVNCESLKQLIKGKCREPYVTVPMGLFDLPTSPLRPTFIAIFKMRMIVLIMFKIMTMVKDINYFYPRVKSFC